MAIDYENRFATRILEKLAAYYGQPEIEEIVMNREGVVFVKRRCADWEEIEAPELDYNYIARQVCRVLANINNANFRETDLPIVSCEVPGQPYRFQAVVGSNVRYELSDRRGIALSVRSLMASTEIHFGDYGLEPGVKLAGNFDMFLTGELPEDHIEQLGHVIDSRQTVVISGATSSGKTTFINQVIKLIDRRCRIITVEDAREVSVPHRNRVHLMVPRNKGVNDIGYPQILDAIVRLTPDFVICGEVSVPNALALFSLMGKGHPVLTTVHAASPKEAMRAFVNNMAMSGSTLDQAATLDNLEAQIGCIVQLEHRHGKRQVIDMVFPSRNRLMRERKAGATGAACAAGATGQQASA